MKDPTRSPDEIQPFRWPELDHGEAAPRPGTVGRDGAFRPDELAADEPGEAVPGKGAAPPKVDPVEEARREAEALLARAREEAEALREQARAEGYEAGRAEGLRTLAEGAEHLEGLCRDLAGHKAALYREARDQVVELTLALVQKLLGPLTEEMEGVVVRVVERALQVLSDRETLTIRVNPDDLQVLLEAKPRLMRSFDGIRQLAVVEDPAVRRGGCQVQTPTAEIDARLETQLEELVRAVREA